MSRRFRSAIDGKFVSADAAAEHPETTVSEEVKTLEITGDMIEIGVSMLEEWSRSHADVEEAVVQLYIAMRSLEK